MHTLTTYIGQLTNMYLLLAALLFVQCSSGKQDDKEKVSQEVSYSSDKIIQREILYKKSSSSESDEYVEGAYYLYDTKDNRSQLLFDGVFVDYSEAWMTTDNQYVIFTISSIILLDENKEIIERFDFKDTELVIGAQYNKNLNRVYFLLKDTERNQVDLCQFSFDNKELKKVIKGIGVEQESIEEPFKKMFFASDNELFIANNCYTFLKVNLKDNSINEVNLDEGSCYGYSLVRNNKGLVYVKYNDEYKISYELKEYDFANKQSKLLLDGKNQYSKPVYLELYSSPDTSPFLVQIDDKYFLYDYSSFNEIKIEASKILSYSEGYLIYLDSSRTVKVLAL